MSLQATSRKAKLESSLLRIWYGKQKPGFFSGLALTLLTWVYRTLRLVTHQDAKCRASKHAAQNEPIVLVVGNLIAGGAGKTPIVMAVCNHLKQLGIPVGVVSRGYGRSTTAPQVFDPGVQTIPIAEAGDEPAFLAQTTDCPVAVGANRQAAAEALCARYPKLRVIVSDDGLQHHKLKRHLEWVVFDSRSQGNGKLLPAGPLREPISRLDSVDAVIANGLSVEVLANDLGKTPTHRWHEAEVFITGFLNGNGQTLTLSDARKKWAGLRTVAFTGMANPDKLFSGLHKLGIVCVQTIALPDHFDYPSDYCRQFADAVLITTGKDAVKLEASNPHLWVAQVDVKLPAALLKSIEDCIGLTID